MNRPGSSCSNSSCTRGAVVNYNDPHIPLLPSVRRHSLPTLASQELTPDYLHGQDCVLIVTDHSAYDWDFIVRNSCAGCGYAKRDPARARLPGSNRCLVTPSAGCYLCCSLEEGVVAAKRKCLSTNQKNSRPAMYPEAAITAANTG